MQKRAEETKRKILQAATVLFSAKGLNGATVDDIANAAGVNKQRLYAYFNSKDHLFESALLNVFENVELFSRKTLDKANKSPERLSEILVEGFLKVHASHPSLWRLLAWANLEGPKCTDALNHARKRENDELRVLFESEVQKGRMRPVKFEIWLFTLLAVTCFRYSNHLTLAHTLGWDPAEHDFEKDLVQEISQLFSVIPNQPSHS
ncbi:MAG: TetR/AcrR family transcriptional regulator [Victivallales bacterium]|nr:TetR/AcrR family transcriptional regulator [Victivallales bacterium]